MVKDADETKGTAGMSIYAALIGLIAAALLFGGGWLASIGGSVYYLLAGLSLAFTAVLVWHRRREGMWLYVGIVCATIAWSIWEVGLSGWALMPRLAAWFVIGAWMLTPRFRRGLKPVAPCFAPVEPKTGWAGLAAAIVAAVLAGLALHTTNPPAPDPRFQTGFGPYPVGRSLTPSETLTADWPYWGNSRGGTRFSPLTQITPANVSSLKKIWSAPVSDTDAGSEAGLEVTPLMIGDTLYACSGDNEIVALDAETGQRRWRAKMATGKGNKCRGVAYYKVKGASGPCAERILTATGTAGLVALDSRSGTLCPGFGRGGEVNLLEGLSKAPAGYYNVTSAPTIVRGKVIVGGWVTDNQFVGEPSGVIRAFDALTGRLAWAWDMGRPGRTGAPAPGETYTRGTPNSWAPMSADESLGFVYVPTGNPTPDYYGAHRRPFDDQYNSSVVALDAATGRVRWSFQTTHHDLWDFDVASQPSLLDLPGPNGGRIPALLQLTKRGEVFLLNRVTGRPLRRVVERPVPQRGKAPEERLSPTQPFSPDLPSFGNARMRETDMWGITPFDQLYCRIKFRQARYDGTLTPPGLSPWISSPGYIGGSNWGGASIDLERGVMVLNTIKLSNYNVLIPREVADARGIKPVGPNADAVEVGGGAAQQGTPYGVAVSVFLSPLGIPCQAPPYGYLSAVDLVTGKLIWSQPLGTARDSGPFGFRARAAIPLGTISVGGSITTRSGLVFIGASQDRTFRAFDVRTGRQLWETYLDQGAYATPMTYISPKSGRQFVIVADAGIKGLGAPDGARLVAYALPTRR